MDTKTETPAATRRKAGSRRPEKTKATPAEQPLPTAAPEVPRATKRSQLIEHLRRDDGATIAELTAAFAWLPHTVRAAITGLRKSGHAVERNTRGDGSSTYRIADAS